MKAGGFRAYKLISMLLAVLFLVRLSPCAFAVTQWEIDEVKKKRDQVSEEKRAQQQVLDELSATRDSIIDEKLALEEHISLTREQIMLNNQEIDLYNGMIEEKEIEVEEAKTLEEQQLERYRTRVRAMEENGTLNFLVLLSASNTLADLLTALDDVGDIMKSDRALEDQYIAARKAHEAKKAEYEEYRSGLVAIREVLEDERDQLEIEISAAEGKISSLQNEISENEALSAEIESRWFALDEQLEELQAQYDFEHTPGSLSGTDDFIWPCGSFYITSLAGERIHPVTGQSRNHCGIDIGAPQGDPIWAAAFGMVSFSGWHGSYGNCVMISHPNGYTSVYGHLSSVAVSEGEYVNAGQTVGYCGSTGLTTGAHLHFEIRSGAEFLNPLAFFQGGSFSYAPDA
jgi:murein DD-endopeptidase MepM/ murein hydrolase activator NlpD